MHIKVQQTRSYPNFVISGQHTCRAMGSNVKSQESPTESSRASSIAFNWEAYSSKNCPYFLNCASPTISINVYDLISNELKLILQFKCGINSLKEPSSKASRCHPSSILKSSRDNVTFQFYAGEGQKLKYYFSFSRRLYFQEKKVYKFHSIKKRYPLKSQIS